MRFGISMSAGTPSAQTNEGSWGETQHNESGLPFVEAHCLLLFTSDFSPFYFHT